MDGDVLVGLAKALRGNLGSERRRYREKFPGKGQRMPLNNNQRAANFWELEAQNSESTVKIKGGKPDLN